MMVSIQYENPILKFSCSMFPARCEQAEMAMIIEYNADCNWDKSRKTYQQVEEFDHDSIHLGNPYRQLHGL
jgi:hypothetical protein